MSSDSSLNLNAHRDQMKVTVTAADGDDDDLPKIPFPSCICHVSRKCRDIAIDLPLYLSKSTLILDCIKHSESSLLPLYLEQSRICLLDMDLMVNFGENMSLSPVAQRTLRTRVVDAIARRWRVSPRGNKSVSLTTRKFLD